MSESTLKSAISCSKLGGFIGIFALLVSVTYLPFPASAVIITYDFTATQSGSSFNFGTGNLGSITESAQSQPSLSGSFSYDTDATLTSGGTGFSIFDTGLISLNEVDLSSVPSFSTRVSNDFSSSAFDNFLLNGQVGASTAPGDKFDLVRLALVDTSGTAFSSTNLPEILNLSDFDTAVIFFQSLEIDSSGTGLVTRVTAQQHYILTSLVNDVSEPASLAILSLGLISIGIVRRKKRQPSLITS